MIKRMNFGMIPIGGCLCVFQDDFIKIPDFSIEPFNRGDEIKAQRSTFPD